MKVPAPHNPFDSILRVDRRRFLVLGGLGAGAIVLNACGDDTTDADTTDAGTTGETTILPSGSGAVAFLAPAFPDGLRATPVLVTGGPIRAPFIVLDESGQPLTSGAPAEVIITVTLDDAVVFSGPVARRGDGLATPYYPVVFDPPDVGTYSALADGTDLPAEFLVVGPGESPVIQVGDAMRPVDTPTADDARGVEPICTRTPDPCALHEHTLTAALALGRPTVLYIGTPAFCQTQTCGPALDFLLDALAERPTMVAVHAEVYSDPYNEDFSNRATTEAVSVYGLEFEPQLVVADATGRVTAVLNASMDATEVAAALDSAL